EGTPHLDHLVAVVKDVTHVVVASDVLVEQLVLDKVVRAEIPGLTHEQVTGRQAVSLQPLLRVLPTRIRATANENDRGTIHGPEEVHQIDDVALGCVLRHAVIVVVTTDALVGSNSSVNVHDERPGSAREGFHWFEGGVELC